MCYKLATVAFHPVEIHGPKISANFVNFSGIFNIMAKCMFHKYC